MTTILHYSRSHKRRVLPPAMAAQPLRPRLLVHLAPDLEPVTVPVPVEIPFTHPAHSPANLHIPAPLLPPVVAQPAPPTPRPSRPAGPGVRNRIRDAWDWLTQPVLQPAPNPSYAALAWALR